MKNLIGLIIVLFVNLNLQSQPSVATIEELKSAVVRVKSGKNIGTGFLWKQNNWIVTTLHVIENQNDIKIKLENKVSNARVIKVLKEYDLVLLELESPSSQLKVLSNLNINPNLNTQLYTMGYNGNGNLNTIIDRTLRLGYNSNGKLEGLLSTKLRDALNICKSPNPSIEILYLEGTLLPGFSGSPIIDELGRLVGVSDGGLEEGSSSISWGIKAEKLTTLLNSNERFSNSNNCGIASQVSFSSESLLEESNIDFIVFKTFKFIKTKLRTVQEMMSTIDDPAGLNQLISGYSTNNNFDYYNTKYDIYEDLYTGITFCVPTGTKLHVNNNLIVGDFINTNYKIVIYPDHIKYLDPNPSSRYSKSASTFQKMIVEIDGGNLYYEKDYYWSYSNGPFLRYDGVKINREAYRGYIVETTAYGITNYLPKTYSFQTHIGRGNYYLGAATLDLNNTIETDQKLNACLNYGECNFQNNASPCVKVCNDYKLYSQLVIGTHMGGFSNNFNRE